MLLLTAGLFGMSAAAAQKSTASAERVWIERAAELAEHARRHVNIGDFRRDVVAHRESLRQVVRARPKPAPAWLKLQRSMVLTNALLHAASECHSGGRVQCPADLMQRIDDQLRDNLVLVAAAQGGGAGRR